MWISNHIGGFFDVACYLTGPKVPAFTPLEKFRKIPIFGYICEAIQCVWIDRGAPKDQLDIMVEAVMERQRKIVVEKESFNPVLSFAEGVNNNGTHLLKFKRGAFQSLLPVRPCYIVVQKCGIVTPTYDVMRFFDLICFMISSCTMYRAKLHILPPFIPNDYLFREHGGK